MARCFTCAKESCGTVHCKCECHNSAPTKKRLPQAPIRPLGDIAADIKSLAQELKKSHRLSTDEAEALIHMWIK